MAAPTGPPARRRANPHRRPACDLIMSDTSASWLRAVPQSDRQGPWLRPGVRGAGRSRPLASLSSPTGRSGSPAAGPPPASEERGFTALASLRGLAISRSPCSSYVNALRRSGGKELLGDRPPVEGDAENSPSPRRPRRFRCQVAHGRADAADGPVSAACLGGVGPPRDFGRRIRSGRILSLPSLGEACQ